MARHSLRTRLLHTSIPTRRQHRSPRCRSKDSIALHDLYQAVILRVLLASVPVAFQFTLQLQISYLASDSGLGLTRISNGKLCLKIHKPIRACSFPPVILRMLTSYLSSPEVYSRDFQFVKGSPDGFGDLHLFGCCTRTAGFDGFDLG